MSITKISIVLLFALLGACSSIEQRQVVAVGDASGSARGNASPPVKQAIQLPPVVASILEKAEQSLASGELNQAEISIQKAQRLSPNTPQVYLLWGRLQEKELNSERARQFYRRAQTLSAQGSASYRAANEALLRLEK